MKGARQEKARKLEGGGARACAGGRDANVRGGRRDAWVAPFFKRYRTSLAVALALGICACAFSVGLMFASGFLISAAVVAEGILFLRVPLGLVQVFGVGRPVLNYLERLASHDWVLRMVSGLRLRLFLSLAGEGAAASGAQSRRMGDALALLNEDIGHLQNLYLRSIFPVAVAWAVMLSALVLTGACAPGVFAVLLVQALVAAVAVPVAAAVAVRPLHERLKEQRADLYADVADNVLGVADWVFAGRGADYACRTRESARRMADTKARISRRRRRRDLGLQALFAAAAAAVVVSAGAQFGFEPGGASNWIAAFALGFFPLADVLTPLPAAMEEAAEHQSSIARLNELPEVDEAAERAAMNDAGVQPAETAGKKAAAERAAAEAPTKRAAGPAVAKRAAGEAPSFCSPAPRALPVVVEDVSFSYPGEPRAVLSGLSLSIGAGEKVALLGRSGAGKSTLAALVRGQAAPDAGSVRIGEREASCLGDDAACTVGVVSQQTYLFNRTLAENLRIAKPEATDAELEAALRAVGLGGLLDRLPQGLETLVDEAGLRFSGGERRRVALARVLLRDVPVVVLDEPTVGLDPATERALLDTLFEALRGRTVLMITHHLAGVSKVDRVAFLEAGRIALVGAPDHLERTSERYRRLLAHDR